VVAEEVSAVSPSVAPMELAIGIAAAAAAVVSAVFVWRQVAAMKRQTTQEREITEGAAQPYVWADVQLPKCN